MDFERDTLMTLLQLQLLRFSSIGCAVLFLLVSPLYAQNSIDSSQDLGSVLNRFATDANVEILFSPDLVNNRNAADEDFSGTPQIHLTKILSGTGLSYEEPSQNVFVIKATGGQQNAYATTSVGTVAISAQAANQESLLNSGEGASPPTRVDLEATAGVISGQVLDHISGQPLAGAIVSLEGSDSTTSTDTRGFYRFSAAPVGEYNVSVSYLGSESQTLPVTVESGQSATLNFSLDNQLEVVVVYGNRSSLQQALNQQRAASNSASVVSSDLLGSFPAETIAEALRRVPGVSFARDAATGEGDRISVRGFNSQAINIQLNGVDLQGTGVDRSVDLSGFLTDNIKQVTIQKSLLPSQEATGSGGLVEIETRSGLDYGDRYLSLSAELENPVASGFGDEFEISTTGALLLTDDLGVSVTVQYRETEGQNYDANFLQTITPVMPAGFTSLFRVPESFDYPFDDAIDSPLYTGTNYLSRQRDETNLTMSMNFAYDWADHTRLRLDLQSIENKATFSTSRTTASFGSGSTDMPVPELNNEVRRRSYIRSFIPQLGINDNIEDLITRSISFRGETNLNNWEFDYTLGYSQIERERVANTVSFTSTQNTAVADIISPDTVVFNTDDDANMTQRAVGGAVVLGANGAPVLSLSDFGQSILVDPSTYFASVANFSEAKDTTDSYVFELDARRYYKNSAIEYVEIGGKYDNRKRFNSDDILSSTNTSSLKSLTRILGINTSINELNSAGFGVTDLADIGLPQAVIPSLSSGSAADFIEAISGLVEDDPNTPENEARFRLRDRTTANPIDDAGAASPAEVLEEIFAAYIESKLVFGDVEFIGGVRYQEEKRTGTTISSPSILLDEPGIRREPRETFIQAGLIDFVDTSSVQKTWTPSVIANYRPTDQVVVRGAYFRSTVHPSIDKIVRPRQIVLDLRPAFANAVIREPNPDLEPSKTDNFDLDFSYYFKENPGLIRLGLFYKKISNNFTNTLVSNEATTVLLKERILSELAPLNDINPDLLALPDNTEYFLSRPKNGEGGNIYGLEAEIIRQLDFLPETWPTFIQNFSVLGNITYTKSDFEDLESARNDEGEQFTLALERSLLGQSKWSGNASIRYEEGAFSGSIIYTYQSESATSYDEFNLNGITPEFDTLDLRLSYTLEATENRPRIILFAEGDDLLTSADEADIRSGIGSEFGDGDTDYFFPTSLQFNGGRRVTVGASIRF